jgi:protein gp37
MAQRTAISWTDVSWNPVHGCSKVSTGCKNCYAETLSLRYGQTPAPWTARNAPRNVLLKPHKLREPLSKAGPWKNPCRVFVNSMSDLFHEEIPDEYIAAVFDVMAQAPQHTFQILTKRPERMRDYRLAWHAAHPECRPLPNVWLGTSIENRKWVGRADVLGQTPAAVRFVSAEPLLGPLIAESMTSRLEGQSWAWKDGYTGPMLRFYNEDGELSFHWLIVGGESGAGHRPFDPEWARDLRDVCHHEGVAFFVKQLGGARPGTALEDLPEDLRIREFPAVAP